MKRNGDRSERAHTQHHDEVKEKVGKKSFKLMDTVLLVFECE